MIGQRPLRILAWVSFLTLAATAHVPASGAEATPKLSISGNSSGYTDVTFSRAFTLDSQQIKLTGKGRFTGIAIDPLDSPGTTPADFLFVWFRDVHVFPLNHAPEALGAGDRFSSPLPRGRYRIYLLSDGPGSISLPILGGNPRVNVRISRPVHPRYRVGDVRQVPGPSTNGLFNGQLRFPITVGPRDLAYMKIAAVLPGPVTVHKVRACVVASQQSDCYPTIQNPTSTPDVVVSNPDAEMEQVTYSMRGAFPKGPADALFQAPTLTPMRFCRGAVLDRFLTPS